MKIGLMGFEFNSANKGCEALVYSFLNIIKDYLEINTEIYNFSGTQLGEVPSYFSNFVFINVEPKLKDLSFNYIKKLSKCDLIFDVTMGDSFSDIYSESFYQGLIRHKRIAELVCKKYVLLPQTYGPFYSINSEKIAKKVFDKAYRIYCRDEISKKMLQNKFGITNSILTSDMAFVLPYDKNSYKFSNKEKIGINVSGLLYRGGFHTENQFGLSLVYSELIDKIIVNLSLKYEIHLIPHVIDLTEQPYDDDFKICRILHEKYPNTILAPAFKTPIQAKSYISNMDIFIGSRMHSTIASFSSGVVTIPISYSRKFEGLFGSLDYPYVINAKLENTDSAYALVMRYIENRADLSESQKKSMQLIEDKNKVFKDSILSILKEI
ncbi:polysaccharide pyruvyl transferase family protein [Amedibacillus dolichus]|uniref:polysaccharide pyruvyl transferase family protein n=1 Tax=Amedibacillus dolichus TaxID=31971 RepID=UPI001EDC3EDD|nr:polysaccharide pyruvyl transferase family protein [Amedibacillus dolichus]MCG4879037.1 polysaccharide pyruvyl transferase family protein [Amedibacillus dolichus]